MTLFPWCSSPIVPCWRDYIRSLHHLGVAPETVYITQLPIRWRKLRRMEQPAGWLVQVHITFCASHVSFRVVIHLCKSRCFCGCHSLPVCSGSRMQRKFRQNLTEKEKSRAFISRSQHSWMGFVYSASSTQICVKSFDMSCSALRCRHLQLQNLTISK